MSQLERLPVFADETVGFEDFCAVYNVVKCVLFQSNRNRNENKNGTKAEKEVESKEPSPVGRKRKRPNSSSKTQTVLEMIRETYESASSRDKDSWNVENNEKGNNGSSPSEFLSPKEMQEETVNTDGYCSFILQDDSNNSVSRFTKRLESLVAKDYCDDKSPSNENRLPHSLLLTSSTEEKRETTIPPKLTLAPHYWIFVGLNYNTTDEWLHGRREHTDSIDHDGTFHHQLLGGKLWKLRPTLELLEICDQEHDMALLDHYEVLVEEGDVLVINTKLWWHQTEIPQGSSVSYARDLYLEHKAPEASESGVGNQEVSWASGFIARGTTLVVDDAIDDSNDHDDAIVSSLYHHLVPPTIRRTPSISKANCKLVLLSTDNGDHDFDSGEEEEPKTKQLALEAIRDIQEGEEFMMLFKEEDTV